MKKLLMGSIVLFVFSISVAIFQISCQKDSTAQSTSGGLTQLNKVIIMCGSPSQIFIVSYDGTNVLTINLPTLPTGYQLYSGTAPSLSPDGKKVFFFTIKPGDLNYGAIYSCNVDGTSLTKVFERNIDYARWQLGGAY